MASIIEMKDGGYMTLMYFVDALDAVEEYAGRELREFIEEYMQDNADELFDARLEAEEARKDSEASADYYREILLAARDGLETLLSRFNAKRLDRNDCRKLTKALYDMVDREL